MSNQAIAMFVVLLSALSACGTLEVGIETTATSNPTAGFRGAPTVQSTPTVSAAPTITATDTIVATLTRESIPPSPTAPKPSAAVTSAPDRITFPVGGNTFTFAAKLVKGAAQRFILRILAQQKMSITTGSNVTISVLDDGNSLLQPSASSPGQWQGTIPQTGDYVIVLLGQGLVTVTIDIPPPGS